MALSGSEGVGNGAQLPPLRKTRKYISCVAIGKIERQVSKASHCGSKQPQKSPDEITLLLSARSTYICVLLFAHIPFVMYRIFNATPTEKMQQYSLLFAMNCTDCTKFAPGHRTTLLRFESLSGKCANFILWQQATIEITRRAHSVSAGSFNSLNGCCSSRIFRSWWFAHSTQH